MSPIPPMALGARAGARGAAPGAKKKDPNPCQRARPDTHGKGETDWCSTRDPKIHGASDWKIVATWKCQRCIVPAEQKSGWNFDKSPPDASTHIGCLAASLIRPSVVLRRYCWSGKEYPAWPADKRSRCCQAGRCRAISPGGAMRADSTLPNGATEPLVLNQNSASSVLRSGIKSHERTH